MDGENNHATCECAATTTGRRRRSTAGKGRRSA
ncbi:hypothetical protein N182_05175 [Sinorhizobium sp. GL2]|nr:hypothetical protein N182_05175 [Sinorhizobium sp. GL2]